MTLRQSKVIDVLHAAPFPLMSAQDIASVINKDGSQTKATSLSGALAGLRGKGVICKRTIRGGRFDLDQMRWMRRTRYKYERIWFSSYRSSKVYWFLTSRATEVYPLGAERLQQRDARR